MLLETWLTETGYSKHREALQLSNEHSKNDPETDPYASKYKARGVLKTLKNTLEDLREDAKISESSPIGFHLAVLDYELGVNFIECEELSTGEEYILKSLAFSKTDLTYGCLSIAAINQLAIVYSNRSTHKEALEQLREAESTYKSIREGDVDFDVDYRNVWLDTENKSSEDMGRRYFESLHTHSLYYLAQVLGHLGKAKDSAKYCHITLVRQMGTKQYEPRDWSLCCATLSQYYLTSEQYTIARYCLACAEFVNKEAFVAFENIEFSEENEKEQEKERLEKSKADIQRCWAKYGLHLIKTSHEKLLNDVEQKFNSISINETDNETKKLRFGDLDFDAEEGRITDVLINNYDQVKKLFNFSMKYLNDAKDFYKLDGYVSDFVEITQDISQFYRHLSLFDNEFENRCKMHKRRIDILKPILLELNPQHYLQISRQITYEIAEAFSEMVDLKRRIMEENPTKLSVNAVRKVNNLILQSAKYFSGFVDSYRKDGDLPKKLEDDDVRGVLMAHLCSARVYAKYLCNDRPTKLEYMHKEKACYDFIVKYCDDNPDAANVFVDELEVCREMHSLFDQKVNTVMNAINN